MRRSRLLIKAKSPRSGSEKFLKNRVMALSEELPYTATLTGC
ncbi:hypothetical protein GGR15_002106 [Butyricimonas paravirosa]|uniref:Uncharacterized protein n=1 Tax=Butyricimonas paravirosa TaxID=1472417 RepID=A0A7X6BJJ9_9BACT|nr:hypothetical protein [Butyricimonas paravirosa]